MVVDDQNPKASILRIAAKSVSSKFDLNKSAEEQLKDLKLLRKKQRSGVMKLVPGTTYSLYLLFASRLSVLLILNNIL